MNKRIADKSQVLYMVLSDNELYPCAVLSECTFKAHDCTFCSMSRSISKEQGNHYYLANLPHEEKLRLIDKVYDDTTILIALGG